MKVALIGAGRMGMQHLKSLRAVPGIVVAGIADPMAEEQLVRRLGGDGVQIYANAAEMLDAVRPLAVHVVTPPESHAALATLALEAGCHVYVEKPFTTTTAEARQVLALAEKRGLSVCAGHQCLFEPQALLAVERLSEFGRVVHATSYFSFRQLRRQLTAVEQCKDILPHAVYPLLKLLRRDGGDAEIEFLGCDARTNGELHALLRIGSSTGLISVSLSGRPVEQFQEVVGTNGSLRIDYVTGSMMGLRGPGTGPGVLLTPYRRAFQTLGAANRLMIRALTGRAGSYSGLTALLRLFYEAIRNGAPSPVLPAEIMETVHVCERLGADLDTAARRAEDEALLRLESEAAGLPAPAPGELVLVTGGSGFLGRHVVGELRSAGIAVRAASRRVPPAISRIAGVDYRTVDLALGIGAEILRGVTTIVHCAAETAGGEREHERNSIGAARNLMGAAAVHGVRRLIHVSSLAVLRPSYRSGRPVDERTEIEPDVRERGAYAWGKAESERAIERLALESGIAIRIVRPGPLIDYRRFEPPGRLGRELGPVFVAIGGRRDRLPVCDVQTAARVIRSYVQDFDSAPPVLNLVEGPPPRRMDLMARYLTLRPDLRVFWFPGWLLRLLSFPMKLAQRWVLGSQRPVDMYAVFAGGFYRTELAERVIARAARESPGGCA